MIKAKKSLGQNFLIDRDILEKITNIVPIKDKHILEVGPGTGNLTSFILKNDPKEMLVIEKDDELANNLDKIFNKQIKIINNDILNVDENTLFKEKVKATVFGNLPYNISSQILVKIIKFKKWPPKFTSLIFMFQKEMADRIDGKYNTPKYGRLSILTNYRLKIANKFNVSPNCFFPRPKINSTVICFEPKNLLFNKIKNINNLEKVTNILFSNKRKMINKSILKIFKSKEKVNLIENLNLNSRPSEIKPEKYYEITKIFESI